MRLARSVPDLVRIVEQLTKKGVGLRRRAQATNMDGTSISRSKSSMIPPVQISRRRVGDAHLHRLRENVREYQTAWCKVRE